MDQGIQQESSIEILRAQRAAARRGRAAVHDTIRENEGVDEDDPLNNMYDGIRLEPFNMRREMAEGHFDEGGFYILNKDEEKEVTDAWLDTVDQAEKTASFKEIDRQKKAGETAASRLTALSRNLGEPDEKEEGEEGEAEEGAAAAEQAKEEPAPEAPKEEEEEDDAADEISMLEALITELLPLEKPSEALARLARASGGAKSRDQAAGGPLKMRSRIRQARAEVAASKAAESARSAQAAGSAKPKPGRRKLTEFGYEESAAKRSKAEPDAEMPAEAGAPSGAKAEDGPAAAAEKDSAGAGGAGGERAGAPAGAAEGSAEAPADGASKPAVADEAAVAAAAEKAAAKDKAEAEAAAAFAKEMRMTRQTLHMAVDGKSGPEASAILSASAEEPRTARMASAAVAASAAADDAEEAPARQQQRKRAADVGAEELERKKKIDRLTDLCDRLLQRGVLVYDSTRELLAIEVRERKGEQLGMDEKEEASEAKAAQQPESSASAAAPATAAGRPADAAAPADAAGAAAAPGDGAAAAAGAGQVLYENRRFQPPDGQPAAVVEAAADAVSAPADAQPLLWQYRWTASPDQIHGPFDSVTMHGWITQGCFAEERPAEVRQCDMSNKSLEGCWHRWTDVNFTLYL